LRIQSYIDTYSVVEMHSKEFIAFCSAVTITYSAKPDSLFDIVRRQRLPEGWVVTIVDARGTRMVRWPGNEQRQPESSDEDTTAQAITLASFKNSGLKATFCSRAWARLTTSLGRPDSASKPSTLPFGT